ncbi:MAG: hypothetical protein AAFQ07_20190, partial [Chloroflexota bacterium]
TTSDVYVSPEPVKDGDDVGKFSVYAVLTTESHGSLKCRFRTNSPEDLQMIEGLPFTLNMAGRFVTYEARNNTTFLAEQFEIVDSMGLGQVAETVFKAKQQVKLEAEKAQASANGTSSSRKKAPSKAKTSDDS